MEAFKLVLSCLDLLLWFQVLEGQSFMIRNVHLKKCIQGTHENGRISLAECKPHSQHQQWSWEPSTSSIISPQSKRCLTVRSAHAFAPVKLEPCGSNSHHQAWTCSKKGHLNLQSLDLHLNAKPNFNKVFVSVEKDKFSKWKTMTDKPVCRGSEAEAEFGGHTHQKVVDMPALGYEIVDPSENMTALPKTSTVVFNDTTSVREMSSTMWTRKNKALLTEEDNNWKIAILVLSPLTFTLGLLILILNIHYNKKKKMLSALKCHRQLVHGATSTHKRTPLTATVGSQQYSSMQVSPTPSLRHGEILIEWKDGTITHLFDNFSYQILEEK